MRELPRNLN